MAVLLHKIPSLFRLQPNHKRTSRATSTICRAVNKSTIRCSTNEETRNSVVSNNNNNNNNKNAIKVTCKNCKTQFDPALNHPRACRFHTAHFGGETKRKFESVYAGGTMDTPDSGRVFQYWHCCGSEDPFDLGCTAAPHSSYDD